MTKKLHSKITDDKGYFNVVYKNGIYLEHHQNGSFTISNDKGDKETYYGYSHRDALNKFKREHKR